MRVFLVPLFLIAATSTASAYCVSIPDDTGSRYVRNGLSHSICLEDDLSRSTERKNFETDTQTSINQIQREILRQRLETPALRFNDPFTTNRF